MSDRTAPRSAAPWRPAETALVHTFTAIGFAALLVAWWGVSGTARISHQVPWVDVAGVAVIFLGASNCLWLLAGRRAVAERRRRVLDRFEHPVGVDVGAPLAGPPRVRDADLVWATGMGHYHRPTCQLVQGKAPSAASLASHRRAGRLPCGMCEP